MSGVYATVSGRLASISPTDKVLLRRQLQHVFVRNGKHLRDLAQQLWEHRQASPEDFEVKYPANLEALSETCVAEFVAKKAALQQAQARLQQAGISASVAEGTAAAAQGGGGGGGAAGSSGALGAVESYGRQATAAERLGQRELEQQQQQQQKVEDSRMQAPHASARRALAEERSRKAPSGLRRAREEEDCAREAKRWASLATRLKLLVVVHREVQPLTLHYLLDKVPPDPRPRYVLAPHPNPSQVDQPRTLQES